MPVIAGLFNETKKRDNPLSHDLRTHVGVRRVIEIIASTQSLAELHALEENLDDLLGHARRQLPALGPPLPVERLESLGKMRQVDASRSVPTTRFWLKVPVVGDPDLLSTWPDAAEGLEPIDAAIVAEAEGGLRELALAEQAIYEPWARVAETWQVRTEPAESGDCVLTTFIDLTDEELRDAAQNGTLRARFDALLEYANAVVAAIEAQAGQYYAEELPAQVRDLVEIRRDRLRVLEAVSETLSFPDTWRPTPPVLHMVAPETSATASSGLEIPYRPRLSEASFEDVLKVIRIWANALERYPDAYRPLVEDRISDLLAATLNATVPGAGREVYSRGGKSDIYVTADALEAGSGPEKAFVVESKWVEQKEDVREAIEDQLMRYSPEGSPSAVFLALSRRGRITQAQTNIRQWAADVPGYQSQSETVVDGWPAYRYDADGETLDICIATVALPEVRSRRGSS